jgi:uncharacterized membrane protein
MKYLPHYITACIIFFFIDLIWLNTVAKTFYREQIGHLLRGSFLVAPAIVFYLLFLVGLLIFAVVPGVQADSLAKAATLGALFGFFTYATYDFTNLATLKDWPILVTVVDLVWGTLLSGSVSTLVFIVSKKFGW